MKNFFKRPLCFILGHQWKEVRIIARSKNGDYLYVTDYIERQKNPSSFAHQCKRCASFILKDETPEYDSSV
jgi:hypothetical protein